MPDHYSRVQRVLGGQTPGVDFERMKVGEMTLQELMTALQLHAMRQHAQQQMQVRQFQNAPEMMSLLQSARPQAPQMPQQQIQRPMMPRVR